MTQPSLSSDEVTLELSDEDGDKATFMQLAEDDEYHVIGTVWASTIDRDSLVSVHLNREQITALRDWCDSTLADAQ